ncbi:hypothetical protein C2G38_2119302 [Gigaspora rosea]|uniref:Protein kinase domain-containing protein n=1 Tax=Gigaspora rosea TaxID=44941 RepID=A0A397U459_9GLOM|nr:hypothetical protein C2G38_2119302 [Gigaspora rosea]
MNCRLSGNNFCSIWTNKKEYMKVFQYANEGNLCDYLTPNFYELIWEDKLSILIDISKDLAKIHKAGFIFNAVIFYCIKKSHVVVL